MKTENRNVHKTTKRHKQNGRSGKCFLQHMLRLESLASPRDRVTYHAPSVNSVIVLCSRFALKNSSPAVSSAALAWLTAYVGGLVGVVRLLMKSSRLKVVFVVLVVLHLVSQLSS